MFQNFVKKTGH